MNLLFFAIALDQIAKRFAHYCLINKKSLLFFSTDSIYFTSGFIWNEFWFTVVNLCLLPILIFLMLRTKNKFLNQSLSYLIAGLASNFIDLMLFDSVIVFLSFNSFPAINIAHIFLAIGLWKTINNLI